MAKKRRKINRKKLTIFIFLLLLLVFGCVFGLLYLGKDKGEDTLKVKSVDTIEGYDYTLNDNATKYYKGLFKELKEVLEADEVSMDDYAELVTKLFVADFFNLDNKVSKSDVGGVQFVYENYREDFVRLARSSMYKSVKSNIYGDRKQKLPIVSGVSTVLNTNEVFKYGENSDNDAYVINFEITYEEDLGYQTEGVVRLIHNDKKLEVATLENIN